MIEIVEYQNRWPDEFEVVAKRVRESIGGEIIGIHHIGSTSVPLLAAKDVIDVQITVSDLDALIEKSLTEIGFEATDIRSDHCPPGLILPDIDLEKRYYRVSDRRINLHVRKNGAFNQRYPILFRDYLRSHPMARDAYGEIKKQLARYFPKDADAYYDIKDPVCDLVISSALEWAKANHWEPGPV